MYNQDQIVLPENQFSPEGAPKWALQGLGELYSRYSNVPDPLTDEFKRELIRGYIAATIYVDAQVGLLINALKKHKLLDNTIIVIFGDNGYQLGEHAKWSNKHTNYETSVLVPLIEIVYELYDHVTDPDENKNIAGDPSMKSIVEILSAQINSRVKNDYKLKKLIMHH
jgi:hypothetical protein